MTAAVTPVPLGMPVATYACVVALVLFAAWDGLRSLGPRAGWIGPLGTAVAFGGVFLDRLWVSLLGLAASAAALWLGRLARATGLDPVDLLRRGAAEPAEPARPNGVPERFEAAGPRPWPARTVPAAAVLLCGAAGLALWRPSTAVAAVWSAVVLLLAASSLLRAAGSRRLVSMDRLGVTVHRPGGLRLHWSDLSEARLTGEGEERTLRFVAHDNWRIVQETRGLAHLSTARGLRLHEAPLWVAQGELDVPLDDVLAAVERLSSLPVHR
ncbi:hypothetical protein [Actinomadura parmotrematis]|uniref:PH domain-containing protein n=1 Tax=Actinomadura parmotrematis TaxID=2864039 RepID=A0ABS7G1R5_9ACTN|nr:hypothetical protein [Actinomadura parmotrematis]MBW8486649.1 hypothetical protein [Actinomadura parmotrematis]